ncbi:alpha/beta hydrolase [uncultured Roseobacter sp.]|uniref:alpha/beta hydrolase n=1 Tax=uncultured Roseobacter sp. TaxID=114847 RepID=UPI002634955F|nr:alpha/beta hydrolase [uncultured Roseobacter sp.]
MPLLRINATPEGLALHDADVSVRDKLTEAACRAGPVIIMVHGYKYDPALPAHCPHRKIFGNRADSWPAALGFGRGNADEGLGIAFGWHARGPLRAVHQRATQLGKSLADIISQLNRLNPHRPIHVIAHSMGVETALSALAHLRPGGLRRMILLAGASYASRASALLDTPAGRAVEVFNITSRENDLFDLAFERLVPASLSGDITIGQGVAAPNVTTLQIDCAATLTALARLNIPIERSGHHVCHWSTYRRGGIMDFYSRLLRDPGAPGARSLAAILPAAPAPRWSGLRAVVSAPHQLMRARWLALLVKKRIMAGSPAQEKRNEHAY